MHGNVLDGPIPDWLPELTHLVHCDFAYNKLTGSLPSSLGKCTALKVLKISHNDIKGELPVATLSKLTQLKRLKIRSLCPPHGSFPFFTEAVFNPEDWKTKTAIESNEVEYYMATGWAVDGGSEPRKFFPFLNWDLTATKEAVAQLQAALPKCNVNMDLE